MESQCVRKSQTKCCLCVSEAEEAERGGEEGDDGGSERERERQAACVFVRYRD